LSSLFVGVFDAIQTTLKDPIEVLVGIIIRSRAKTLKYAFNELIQSIWANVDFKEATTSYD
jgi:hypothetical protein